MRANNRHEPTPLGTGGAILLGAIGGAYGAGAMSVFRLAMYRAGVIDKMVPQVMQEWIRERSGAEAPEGSPTSHHIVDQVLHLGYGVALGAMCGPVLARRGRKGLWFGASLGLGLWAVAALGIFPILRVARPAWRSRVGENATNIAAHLVYGLAVQLLTEEPPRQPDRRPTSDAERQATRVG